MQKKNKYKIKIKTKELVNHYGKIETKRDVRIWICKLLYNYNWKNFEMANALKIAQGKTF